MRGTILTLAFLLSILFTVSAQPPLPEGEPGVDYNVENAQGKQGEWIRVYEDGSLYYSGQFKNDKPYGVFKYYYESGELMARHEFIEGHTVVEGKTFYRDGTLQSEGRYASQKKEGEWKFYNRDGKLVRVEQFKNDMSHGPVKLYYPSGELLEESTYENDQRQGSWAMYYDNGEPKIAGHSVDDKHHGEFVYYFENGQKQLEGRYQNGMQEGQWIEYHKDGRIRLVLLYKNGKIAKKQHMNGTFLDYYVTDIPKSEYRYKDGKKHGMFTEWYDQGEFKKVQTQAEGPGSEMQWKEKLVGQQVRMEGEYYMGEPDGEFLYFNEDGRLMKTEIYEEGELVETIEN
jgi:antitoxin component YwqK of YwqJK toxin-antitoxin module